MKAKACVRCRQWKVGCDADLFGSEGCSRCRNLQLQCTLDTNFRRIPKRKRPLNPQAETHLLTEPHRSNSNDNARGNPLPNFQRSVGSLPVNESNGEATATQPPSRTFCVSDKSIADIYLSSSQVNQLFSIYFKRCHPYLPFSMCQSAETLYERCPLLFWTICAVTSAEPSRTRFVQTIQTLTAAVLDPTLGTVEVVQALLILCMWPFRFVSQSTDPSFLYCGLATQLGLQIGLHRPTRVRDFELQSHEINEDEDVKRTTWLACFVVNQVQASRRGVPATIQADFTLLSSLDSPEVPTQLSNLFRISYLTVESANAIGARGSHLTGLVDPGTRIGLIKVFERQFDELKRRYFPDPSDIVEMFFLSSRLQLWSFALHQDVPVSADAVQIVYQARDDAMRLIQISSEKNLSLVPFYTCRSVCYSALMLYRIKFSLHGTQDQLVDDHIERAQQALTCRTGPNLGEFLSAVTSPENTHKMSSDKLLQASHRSRMSACFVFDFARAYAELLKADFESIPEFLDLDGILWNVPDNLV